MTPQEFAHARRLFDAAMELPQAERTSWLDQTCPEDGPVRALVARLLDEARGRVTRLERELETTAAGLAAGSTFGPYRLVELLGEGGMGEVWRAEQQQPVRRRVALKLIKAGMDTRRVIARFDTERQALALMSHSAIARVFDAGATPAGRPYFVMEDVAGLPITRYCDEHRLDVHERLRLLIRVCDGVQHAHRKGIIHRDLKPSNILVAQEDGRAAPKIIDFGIAKAMSGPLTEGTCFTEIGVPIGTPDYMSPEQLAAGTAAVDTRTDVYALGMILYELLVGALPFEGTRQTEAEARGTAAPAREARVPRPSALLGKLDDGGLRQAELRATLPADLRNELRGDLDWIAMRALEPDPERRYGSPADLAADLERYLSALPVTARAPRATYVAWKFVRRHRLGVAMGTALTLTLLIGIVGTTIGLMRALHAEAEAREQRARAEQRFDDVRKLADTLLFDVHAAIEQLPGSTAAREMIVQTSLEYLDALAADAADAADDASLQRDLAMAYEKVADVQGGFRTANLGNRPGAIASYGKALAIRTALLDVDPTNRGLLRELLRNYGKLSDVSLDNGNPEAALEYSERRVALAEKLAFAADATADDRRNVATAWLNIGYQLALMQQVQRGLPLMRRAARLYETLAAGPEETALARRYLALAYQRIGEILLGSPYRPAEALEAYRKSLAVTEGLLRAHPRYAGLKKIHAYALLGLAAAHTGQGDPRAALDAQRRAANVLRDLLDADPKNEEARFDTANALGEAVDPLLALRELDAAERQVNESISVLAASRSTAEAQHSHARILLALDHLRLATVSALRAADAGVSSGVRMEQCATARSWFERSAPILRAAGDDAIWRARLAGRLEYVENLLGPCGAGASFTHHAPSSAASPTD